METRDSSGFEAFKKFVRLTELSKGDWTFPFSTGLYDIWSQFRPVAGKRNLIFARKQMVLAFSLDKKSAGQNEGSPSTNCVECYGYFFQRSSAQV